MPKSAHDRDEPAAPDAGRNPAAKTETSWPGEDNEKGRRMGVP